MTTDITELAQRARINAECGEHLSPAETIELVEALERAQQYAKERDAENQDLMLTVGRLRVEREELESRTVKLPAEWWVKQGSQSLLAYEKQMLLDALNATGIKWRLSR
ncbi:hypothetical protein CPZ26_014985 [Raoultella ornithinolytica]|uniref:ead/Ea22-like family protein n=1 Tax=Raoultella ornithinolytica TaxID=54291 RepID=UPI000BE30F52|nr:ead/Ea22-like family protein [Raoultella ornithinolytica]PJF15782.1 hypothetical protein CU101_02750 [Raoultella ornithinolytica]PJO27236.1 hypothetical protein CPZ26_014985 [Raoultella ornithinolytica]